MQRRSPASCIRSTTCARRSARPSKVSVQPRRPILSIGRCPVSDFDSSFEAGQLAALFKPKLTSDPNRRSEEHTSELQSLMRISYAVVCLKKKNTKKSMKTVRHAFDILYDTYLGFNKHKHP